MPLHLFPESHPRSRPTFYPLIYGYEFLSTLWTSCRWGLKCPPGTFVVLSQSKFMVTCFLCSVLIWVPNNIVFPLFQNLASSGSMGVYDHHFARTCEQHGFPAVPSGANGFPPGASLRFAWLLLQGATRGARGGVGGSKANPQMGIVLGVSLATKHTKRWYPQRRQAHMGKCGTTLLMKRKHACLGRLTTLQVSRLIGLIIRGCPV